METCRSCQDDIAIGEEAKVVEPNGKATFFCVTCVNNMIAYMQDGRAETANLNEL
jgi:hypothetical protein